MDELAKVVNNLLKEDRLNFEIGDTKIGLKNIDVIATLKLHAKIKDSRGFIKIINEEIKEEIN